MSQPQNQIVIYQPDETLRIDVGCNPEGFLPGSPGRWTPGTACRGVHDRFLILDGRTVYHIGASLKDLGKALFAFSRLEIPAGEILSRLR